MPARRRSAEKVYQDKVTDHLKLFGYAGCHVFPLRDEDGIFRTPAPRGWPDLTYLRPPRVLAIEVKGPRGRPNPLQIAWLSLWAGVPCARAWVTRPHDPPWETLIEWMQRPANAPHAYGFTPVDHQAALTIIDKARKRRKESA